MHTALCYVTMRNVHHAKMHTRLCDVTMRNIHHAKTQATICDITMKKIAMETSNEKTFLCYFILITQLRFPQYYFDKSDSFTIFLVSQIFCCVYIKCYCSVDHKI